MKPARLLGHSTHPPTTHVPLGLGLVVPVWQGLALWLGQPRWGGLAFWTGGASLVGSLPALTTGLLEFATIPEGGPAEKIAYWHMGMMLLALSFLAAGVLFQGGAAAPAGARLVASVGSSCAGALTLGVGGWLGGELVYRYGVG